MSITVNEGIFASAVNAKISRRSFLKWSAAIGATASASGLILSSAAKKAGATAGSLAPATARFGIQDWVPTHCLVCHSWCNLAVGIDTGGCVRKIEGSGGQPKANAGKHLATMDSGVWNHQEDRNYTSVGQGFLPYSPNNKGKICAKGNSGMQHLYDPDRVKYPLERVGDRGSGRWRRISWDDALDRIADVLRELGNAGATDVDGNPRTAGEVSKDLRHRFVFYVGRNEYGAWTNRFTASYGTPNHIEHTSLCESSRHTAQIKMMDDKFPLPDLTSHSSIPNYFGAGSGINSTDDVDFMLEVGGNPCEVKIPMTSYGVRWGEMRRRGARLVVVDPRQSNTAAFADEWIKIIPGTDGALAAAMIYEIGNVYPGGWTALKAQLDSGHLAGKYNGFFISQEAGPDVGNGEGTAYDGVTPQGKSLERYLRSSSEVTTGATNDPDDQPKNAAWADAITGIPASTIQYLAAAVGQVTIGGFSPAYNTPLVDGYRGPSKHSNGVYNYRLLRSLQMLAGLGPNSGGRKNGGVDKVGGLQHSAWRGQIESGTWWAAGGGDADKNGGAPPGFVSGLPGPVGDQRIDNWDYENGDQKYKIATHKCDQMVVPGIRASLGMHPYVAGASTALDRTNASFTPGGGVRRLPYFSHDPDFKVEALMIFKNAPGFNRANIKLDQEVFTKKDPFTGKYLLKHFWAIDMQMGDASRFADMILPEKSYLERYTYKHYETFGLKTIIHLRQPVIQNTLYEALQNGEIFWDLGRRIGTGSPSPWGANLFNSWNWAHPDGGGAISIRADALEAHVAWTCDSNGIPGLQADGTHVDSVDFGGSPTAEEKKRFMKTNGMLWLGSERCNYFPRGQLGNIGVYHAEIDGTTDPSTGIGSFINTLASGDQNFEPDGSFFGYPLYVPLTQQTDANYPLHLTTYKLNVHTQSRTASVPRLTEIIGNNWAVMSKATADTALISNGDTVRVTSAQGSIEIEAKVTPKISDNVVAISNSFGHEVAGEANITDWNPGDPADNSSGHGTYLVVDTSEASYADVNRKRGVGMYPSCISPYDRALPPSAPGRGRMPNHVIRRNAGSGQYTGEMATDPIGCSIGWFDTKVNIAKA